MKKVYLDKAVVNPNFDNSGNWDAVMSGSRS
jgi:hypothetical protein